MRIVHFSDWHWDLDDRGVLPEADLYACTGDMLPDTWYDCERAAAHQRRKVLELADRLPGGFRSLLGSPAAPVVCVRGNHDFADLAPLFVGGETYELVNNEVYSIPAVGDVSSIQVTGHRGIPWIGGHWSGETRRPDLLDVARAMPAADVYLTHYPPAGLGLDAIDDSGQAHVGLDGLAEAIARHHRPGGRWGLHFHGHVHERGGCWAYAGNVLHVNAATCWVALEGDPVHGWRVVEVGP